MQIEPVEEDPIRKYTPTEEELLTQNLFNITKRVRIVDCKNNSYSIKLICDWHEHFFYGVREHAGRYRTADYGEERLIFGDQRSADRSEVEARLRIHEKKTRGLIDQLKAIETKIDPPQFLNEVIKGALWAHADLIRIHPFRDGNGRIGRLICTYIMCLFGFPPFAFEVVKQEYLDCLNLYYKNDDIEPLISLVLRIYKNNFQS